MRGKNFFIPLPASYQNFTPLNAHKRHIKAKRQKSLPIRFFPKNAAEGILEAFLRHQEKGTRSSVFSFPVPRHRPCLASQKTQGNLQAGADKPRPCRFFPGFGFFWARGSGRKEKTKQPPACSQLFI